MVTGLLTTVQVRGYQCEPDGQTTEADDTKRLVRNTLRSPAEGRGLAGNGGFHGNRLLRMETLLIRQFNDTAAFGGPQALEDLPFSVKFTVIHSLLR